MTLFADGYGKSEILCKLGFGLPYIPKPEQREAAKSLIRNLQSLPEKECLELIQDIWETTMFPAVQKQSVSFLQKQGRNHMIIFDVHSPIVPSGIKKTECACDAGNQRFLKAGDSMSVIDGISR